MRFKAFISYSHAGDGRLAPALQNALSRFAKKWHARRALRAFRDETNLSSNPGLWTAIEQALNDSEFFILLASPEAAQSKWVAREVETWRRKSNLDTLLLAVTDGSVDWDGDVGDFRWPSTTAVPRTLGGAYSEEPFFVDLRWARTSDDLSLNNPRFADQIATLAAKLHGREKDDLIGEDVRQRRRFVAASISVAVALAILTVVSAVGGIVAWQQKRQADQQRAVAIQEKQEADRQRLEAERRGKISLAQALASDAIRQQQTAQREEIAALLAAEAFRLNQESSGDRLSQIDQALRQVLSASSFSTVLNDGPAKLSVAAIDQGAGMLAGGGESNDDGYVRLWDLRTRTEVATFVAGGEAVTSMDFAGGGRLAVGTRDGHVALWDVRDPRAPRRDCSISARPYRAIQSLTVRRAAGVVAAAAADGSITLLRAPDCTVIQALGPYEGVGWAVDFADNAPMLVAGFGSGVVRMWRVSETAQTDYATLQAGETVHAVAIDPSGKVVAIGRGGSTPVVELWDVSNSNPTLMWNRRRPSDVISVAFSPDGRRLGVGTGEGGLQFFDLAGQRETETSLPSQGRGVISIAFDAVEDVLASADRDGSIRIASLGPRLGVPTILGSGDSRDQVHAVAVSADGRLLASADGAAGTIRMWTPLEPPTRVPPLRYGGSDSSKLVRVAVSPKGDVVAAGTSDLSDGDNSLLVWRLSDRSRGMKAAAQSPLQSLAFSTDGRFLAAITEADAEVVIWSVESLPLSSRRVALPSRAVGACFVPHEDRLMLALRDHSLHAWNSAGTSADRSIVLTQDGGPISAIACAGESGNIGTGDESGAVALWNQNGQSILKLRGQNTPVTAIGTDKQSSIVVTGDASGNLRVWTVAKPNDAPVVIPSTLVHVASLAVDPSGEWVVASGNEKVLKIDLTATLMRKAEARMWRNLSLDEWRRFVGDILPPRATFSRLPPPR